MQWGYITTEMNYIYSILVLTAYWWLHSKSKSVADLTYYIQSNPKLVGISYVLMLLGVYFQNIIAPIMAAPLVAIVSTAYLSGSLLEKIASLINKLKP